MYNIEKQKDKMRFKAALEQISRETQRERQIKDTKGLQKIETVAERLVLE